MNQMKKDELLDLIELMKNSLRAIEGEVSLGEDLNEIENFVNEHKTLTDKLDRAIQF